MQVGTCIDTSNLKYLSLPSEKKVFTKKNSKKGIVQFIALPVKFLWEDQVEQVVVHMSTIRWWSRYSAKEKLQYQAITEQPEIPLLPSPCVLEYYHFETVTPAVPPKTSHQN